MQELKPPTVEDRVKEQISVSFDLISIYENNIRINISNNQLIIAFDFQIQLKKERDFLSRLQRILND